MLGRLLAFGEADVGNPPVPVDELPECDSMIPHLPQRARQVWGTRLRRVAPSTLT